VKANPRRITLPETWTPEQALAAFKPIDFIRDQLWAAYGHAIQQALRDDRITTPPRQPPTNHEPETPF